MHSVPTAGGQEDQPYDPSHSVEAKMQGRMTNDDDIEKTGRPEWLGKVSLESVPRPFRRVVAAAAAAALLLLLFGVFYFALGPHAPPPETSHASPQNVVEEAQAKPSLGTYIGYPGTYKTGVPPEYAQEMDPAPSKTRGVSPIQTGVPGFGASFNPFRHMGPLSPYYSAQWGSVDNAKYLATPRTSGGMCTLSQVHILHRHGSRYPTGGAPTQLVRDLVQKRGETHAEFSGPLAFLNTYEYRVGEELLVPLGREQLHMSGVKSAIDYGALAERDLKQNKKLFVRTGSQQRIVDSALAWSAGFWGNPWPDKTDFEVQIEENHFNTTLAPNFACSAAAESFAVQDYVKEYLAQTTAELQKHAKNVKLTPMLVHGMQQLCSYDTVAFGQSPFCGLFSEADWRGYEFAWDQRFFYDYGPGAEAGAAMGLGWVNEFVSRLTHTPWNAATQTSENATFNRDPKLFPVDRAIYADFTHDSVLTSVLAALRLKEFAKPPVLADKKRTFRTSHVVPFSARMIFEKYDCAAPLGKRDATSYMRMKLNDAIVPLGQLSKCPERADGLCPLSDFLASLADRNDQGWWDKCEK